MTFNADFVIPVGGCRTAYRAPHLYYIVCDSVIYIGETQQHPVIRWGQHLEATGSFLRASRRSLQRELLPNSTIKFSAFCLEKIMREVSPARWKMASQWIEHQVHVLLSNSPVGVRYNIVSDTSRTAPICLPAPGLDLVAKIAFDRFRESLNCNP
jgi:hypothetical protein